MHTIAFRAFGPDVQWSEKNRGDSLLLLNPQMWEWDGM